MKYAVIALLLVACGLPTQQQVADRTDDASASANSVDREKPAPALEKPSVPPPPAVRELAIAANNRGAVVVYTRGGVIAIYDASGHEGSNPLYESANELRLKAAMAEGDHAVVAFDEKGKGTPQAGLGLVGGALPGGSVVSAAKTVKGGTRTTQSSSFGTLVRSGLAGRSPDGHLQVLATGVDENADRAVILTLGDGEPSIEAITEEGSPLAAFATAGDKRVIAWREGFAEGGDGDVYMQLPDNGSGAPPAKILAPVRGVPAGAWTDGSKARIIIKIADSTAIAFDGKTAVPLPRSDEAACTAVMFDREGHVLFLSAGPKSAVLYRERDNGTLEAFPLREREVSGEATQACAIAISEERIHVAWTEGPTDILYAAYQYTSVSNVLKTKHDTVKNSINNVR